MRDDVTKFVTLQSKEYKGPSDALQDHCKTTNEHYLVHLSTVLEPFRVSAHISRVAEHTGRFQFVYVNRRLVTNKCLYKTVTKLLEKSFYLRNIEKEKNERPKERPVFVIDIQCPHSEYDITYDPKKQHVEFKKWDVVMKCLEACIAKFVLTEGDLNAVNESPDKKEQDPPELCKEASNIDDCPLKSKVLYGLPVKRPVDFVNIENDRSCGDRHFEKAKSVDDEIANSNVAQEDNRKLKNEQIKEREQKIVTAVDTVPRVGSQLQDCKYPTSSVALYKRDAELIMKSDSDRETDIENPFPFRVPTLNPILGKKRFLSEHVITESESDLTPAKQMCSWSSTNSTKAKYSKKKSMLPILSESFLGDSIRNALLTRQMLRGSSKMILNDNSFKGLHINLQRSIRRNETNDLMNMFETDSVSYLKKEKRLYLNFSNGSKSIITKHYFGGETCTKQHPCFSQIITSDQKVSNHVKKCNIKNTSCFNRKEQISQCCKSLKSILKENDLTASSKNSNIKLSNKKEIVPKREIIKAPNKLKFSHDIKLNRKLFSSKKNINVRKNVQKQNLQSNKHNKLPIEIKSSRTKIPQFKVPLHLEPIIRDLPGIEVNDGYIDDGLLAAGAFNRAAKVIKKFCPHFEKTISNSDTGLIAINNRSFNNVNSHVNTFNSCTNANELHDEVSHQFNVIGSKLNSINENKKTSFQYKNSMESPRILLGSKMFNHCQNTINSPKYVMYDLLETSSNENENTNTLADKRAKFPSRAEECVTHVNDSGDEHEASVKTYNSIVERDSYEEIKYQSDAVRKDRVCSPRSLHNEQFSIDEEHPRMMYVPLDNVKTGLDNVQQNGEISRQTSDIVQDVDCILGKPNNQESKSKTNKVTVLSTNRSKVTYTNRFCNMSLPSATDTGCSCDNTNEESKLKSIHFTSAGGTSFQNNEDQCNDQLWKEENTPNGRVVYIHPVTGMSSFCAPLYFPQALYTLHNRHWFMTKGTSPLLHMKNQTNELRQLTELEKHKVQNIVVSKNEFPLDKVKWENVTVGGK